MEIHEKVWLIDLNEFMEKINHSKMTKHYEMPRLRYAKQSIIWNSTHDKNRQIVGKEILERCIASPKVYTYRYDHDHD